MKSEAGRSLRRKALKVCFCRDARTCRVRQPAANVSLMAVKISPICRDTTVCQSLPRGMPASTSSTYSKGPTPLSLSRESHTHSRTICIRNAPSNQQFYCNGETADVVARIQSASFLGDLPHGTFAKLWGFFCVPLLATFPPSPTFAHGFYYKIQQSYLNLQ